MGLSIRSERKTIKTLFNLSMRRRSLSMPTRSELPSKPTRKQRQEAKAPRAGQSAVYVPYRRRSATGAVRVAPALVPAWQSWHSERRFDG